LIAIRVARFLQEPSACNRGIKKNQNGRHSRSPDLQFLKNVAT